MKKWIKRVVIAFVLLIVIGVVGLVLFIDQAATRGLEAGGTTALGVTMHVDQVSVGLLSSSVTIQQLTIGNPEGYKTERLFALGRGKGACDLWSLFGEQPHVYEIVLEEPELTIELKHSGLSLGRNNLGDLIKNLDSDKEKRSREPQKARSRKTFRIDLIRITGAKVRFHLLAGRTADLTLPDIELKDLKNSDGTPLLLADVFRQVLSQMGVAAFKKAKGIVPDDLLNGFGNSLGSATALIRGLGTRLTERVGRIGKEATGLVGDSAKELRKGAKGLLEGTGEVGKGVVEGAGKVGKKLGEGAGKLIQGTGKRATDTLRGIFGKRKRKEEKKEE